MKRKRLTAVLGAAALLAAFAATSYVYYLKQQSAALLAAREIPEAAGRYARIQEVLKQASQPAPAAAEDQDWPTRLPETNPGNAALLQPLKEAEIVYIRLQKEIRASEEWIALRDNILNRPTATWSEADWERVTAFLAAHAGLLAEIRAMANATGPLYPLDLSQGYATLMPHLAPTRDLARLLQAEAIARGHAGDYAGAAEDILAGLRLGARMREEPVIISQLVNMAINNLMYEGVTGAFPEGQIPPGLAAELARHFHVTNFSEALLQSIHAEEGIGMDYLAQIMDSGWQAGGEDMAGLLGLGANNADAWAAYLYTSPLAGPWQHLDMQAYARIMNEFEATLELPYYEARHSLDAIAREVEGLPFTRLFTRNMIPSMFGMHATLAREQARQQILLLGIALESYANEHGAYPPDLADVQGAANGASIIDPFTGEPFHYSTGVDGMRLYSEGMDAAGIGNGRLPSVNIGPGSISWRGNAVPGAKIHVAQAAPDA